MAILRFMLDLFRVLYRLRVDPSSLTMTSQAVERPVVAGLAAVVVRLKGKGSCREQSYSASRTRVAARGGGRWTCTRDGRVWVCACQPSDFPSVGEGHRLWRDVSQGVNAGL